MFHKLVKELSYSISLNNLLINFKLVNNYCKNKEQISFIESFK